MKQKRTVNLSKLNKPTNKGGSHYRIYGYTIIDLAALFNLSQDRIRHLISAKLLDPTSLESIAKLYRTRHQ